MSPWNECLASAPRACESVCCICVRGSLLLQKNCVQLRHGDLSTMTTTYRNRPPFVALQNHSQHVPPYQFQRGGEGGPSPPKSIPFQLKSIPWGGGGGHIDSINLFGGGRGGGWRALSFDISILSRGQINFQPTPIFVNKNSSFALPELAFVIFERCNEPIKGYTILDLSFLTLSHPLRLLCVGALILPSPPGSSDLWGFGILPQTSQSAPPPHEFVFFHISIARIKQSNNQTK